MKKIMITIAALAAMTSVAGATDLPLKKKHHKAPLPPVAAVSTPAPAFANTLSMGYGVDFAPSGFKDKADDAFGVNLTHQYSNGLTAGLEYGDTHTSDSDKQRVEVQGGYRTNLTDGVSVYGKAGVGERWIPGDSYQYFALYAGGDYKITDNLTWNAISYRYRNTFDASKDWQQHEFGTGLTYGLTQNVSLTGKIYRDVDQGLNGVDNGVLVGVSYRF